MNLCKVALKSAWNRRQTLVWVMIAIALSTFSLLAIERVRSAARDSFASAVTGTDLLVGARSGSIQLLLYSVFRIGEATSNMSWGAYEKLATHPAVAWTIPISLGDSHRGYPVVATDDNYLQHYQYGEQKKLEVAQGRWFKGIFEVVLGAEVARQLGYSLGSKLTLTHGSGEVLGQEHADKPFTVSGVLAPTGTPVDRSLHISLAAMEAIHLGWSSGLAGASALIPAEMVTKFDLTPKSVTAMLVGLKNRAAVFEAQRFVNSMPGEALMGVLPGVALDQLWQGIATLERLMWVMAAVVGVVSLLGLVAVMLAGLAQRRRELAVLRAVGYRPLSITLLLLWEGLLVILIGCLLGAGLLLIAMHLLGPYLLNHYGVQLGAAWHTPWGFSVNEWIGLGVIIISGLLVSMIPAWSARRVSLSDGLLIRQ